MGCLPSTKYKKKKKKTELFIMTGLGFIFAKLFTGYLMGKYVIFFFVPTNPLFGRKRIVAA